jgi:phosphoribosylformylglycinamidine synthase subunit PurQ / glutaminase
VTARIGVVTFPGSLDDRDAATAVRSVGGEAVALWHEDDDVRGVDAVVLPGGFSYGDYLRCGAIAHLAPVMRAIGRFAADGGPVLGICNGFQVLCEARLLPGALLRNEQLRFVSRRVRVVVERTDTPFSAGYRADEEVVLPVKHGEGRYVADAATLDRIEAEGQVVFRYAGGHNPNGSANDIAGVTNAARNVVGLMPHPEHAIDPTLTEGTGGRAMFEGLLATLLERARI